MHEHIDFPGRSAIKVKKREEPGFTYPWHFHSEYELLYVIDGTGTSYVADSIQPFNSGDLVLLGSNLPHFWKNDESYELVGSQKKVKYVVIQFPDDFFHDQISKYPEFRLIADLLERSNRGIRFQPKVVAQVSNLILEITDLKGFERIIELMKVLQMLAETNEYELLAGEFYQPEKFEIDGDRLTSVMHYININYQHTIKLEKVAEMAHLHPSAFCRFFKEKTGKSLLGYVNDMRISYACKLIIEHKQTISQVCFEAGFNNLSNFNRIFKKHTGFTPTEYYRQFNKN
ncbi:AraC family transcriptional regulator [Maribellus maritimus]|uniref:AraC family transcriptional regulator n=1 Tax=Maribellus maritimus TaxID=2870838 RepID=UPI001EECA5F9|nr:AraC family transcriptional regulator [Maribellus maritimus]MCG6189052.1 AraC family transcriptional regulator [Maribellus maritimus]